MLKSIHSLLVLLLIELPTVLIASPEDNSWFQESETLVVAEFNPHPKGSIIKVDGHLICKESPCSKYLSKGVHEILIESDRYVSINKKVSFLSDTTVDWELTPDFGWLNVTTEPSRIEITLDGKRIGKSPVEAFELSPTVHELTIDHPGFYPEKTTFTVRRDETVSKTFRLKERVKPARPEVKQTGFNPGRNEFISIKGSCFNMRRNDYSIEKKVKKVCLKSYKLQKFEVSVAEYRKCVEEKKCSEPTSNSSDSSCNWDSGRDHHPVNCVDWQQSSDYCKWTGGNLPTEAQWEYAALGENGKKYPWGNTEPSPSNNNLANCSEGYCFDGYPETSPVGSFEKGKSPFGLYDMAGNVWELTQDWSNGKFYKESANNRIADFMEGNSRVYRGGSWFDSADISRPAFSSYYFGPSYRGGGVGFRCAIP